MKALTWTLAGAAILCLVVPLILIVVVSFTASPVMSFPPDAFSLRWYRYLFESRDWLSAIRNSVVIASLTAILSTVAGTLAALALSGSERVRHHGALRLLVLMPLLISPIVIGLSLLMFTSVVGCLYQSFTLVVLAHSLWGMPLVVLMVGAVLAGLDPALLEAARDAGANAWQAFWEVTFPLARRGILIGWVFAFLASFEEFVMALFLTTPETITLQVKIWSSLKYEVSPVVAAVSSLQMALILVLLAAVGLAGRRGRVTSNR